MNTITSFLITTIAGLSTIIGIIPCFLKSSKQDSLIAKSLAFSSGVMITISLISLIPESSNTLSTIYKPFPAFVICAIFIIIGIIISTIVDDKVEKKLKANNLYKLGIITTIVLMLHNIPEDCSCYVSQ